MGGFGDNQFEMTTASNANSFVAAQPAGSFLASSVEGKPRLYLLPPLTSDVSRSSTAPCTTSAGACTTSRAVRGIRAGARVAWTGIGRGLPPTSRVLRCLQRHTREDPPARYEYQKEREHQVRTRRDPRERADGRLGVARAVDATRGRRVRQVVIERRDRHHGGPRIRNKASTTCTARSSWGPRRSSTRSPRHTTTGRGAAGDSTTGSTRMCWSGMSGSSGRTSTRGCTTCSRSIWERGGFPNVVQNGTESIILENPWVNGTKAAPLDQSFYLVMNVAVGGTNGWFPDGPEKPWLDGSATAPRDFLRTMDKWYPLVAAGHRKARDGHRLGEDVGEVYWA
ncbi:hypothetical protein C8J57DRAFT_760203 [Mycena rebaudengoi]|nr:hypothetical protein C8J57DRAFT_760203 [Mycena rebaudengoi]